METVGDATIVAGLRAHDRSALADLYDRDADRLLGFCTGMLRDSHEAADALHDTILVAAERIEQLRDPERLRPWLYAIARTQCLARMRKRERTSVSEAPTELTGGRPMVADASGPDDTARGAESGEAGELVWAAAAGLDDGDRVLLELNLRQGLVGAELAAAAGVKPGQVSMVTGRMRERLERSLGALLVARHGRSDCADLGAILKDWDGKLTVLVRKRVARHVDRCEVCADRRSGLVAPLGSLAVGLPVVLVTTDVRELVLAGVDRLWGGGGGATPDVTGSEPWGDDGFPPVDPEVAALFTSDDAPRDGSGPSRAPADARRKGLVAAALVVLLLIGAAVVWRSSVSKGDDEVAATDVGSDEVTTTSVAAGGPVADEGDPEQTGPTTTTDADADDPTPTEGPSTTTTTAPLADPTQPGGAGPTPTTQPAVGSGGSSAGGGGSTGTIPAPSPTNPPNPAPVIGGTSLDKASLQTTCNPMNDRATASASVSDTGGSLTVVLHWVHPTLGAGQQAMSGGGTYTAVLGPFTETTSVSDPVRWWVMASDGTNTTRSAPRTVVVDPCPG